MKVILKILYGSRMYGTETPNSDYDYRGILMPSISDMLKISNVEVYQTFTKVDDIMMFSFRKFFYLVMKCNPSVIEWLYAPESNIIIITNAGRELKNMKSEFLSKRNIYDRFRGYAYSEYLKLKTSSGKTDSKRKLELEKYGYCVSSASNCLRILQEAVELLRDGTLTFPRHDAILLKNIKKGTISYDSFNTWFNVYLKFLDEEYEYSFLPEKIDYEGLENKMVNMILDYSEVF